MRHEVQDNIVFVFHSVEERTRFDEKNKIPHIRIADEDILNYLELNGFTPAKLKVLNPGMVIGNSKGLPTSNRWEIEIIEEEECGQTKLIPKISGNLKRNSKKENES
jgi:hypothetical protein